LIGLARRSKKMKAHR